MNLSQIVEQIKSVSVLANEDVENGAIETLNARRGRKARAVESMKDLKRQYTLELMRSAVFILVAGASKDTFTSIATESFGCFSAGADDFYNDLANRIPESVYAGKESVANLFDIVGRHLEDKAGEIGIVGYPQFRFKSEYKRHIGSKAEFVSLLKQAFNEQIGGELVGINATHALTDSAIAKSHSARITPIILNTDDEKLALELIPALERLTPKVFLVVSGKASKATKSVSDAIVLKDSTPETVEAALTTIRGSLRK